MAKPAANKRIDAGIKRGPKQFHPDDLKPAAVENRDRAIARTAAGTFLPIFTPEQRQAVLADALVSLQRGLTTEDIAAKHGVSGSAVRTWLIAAGDEHSDARTLFYSRMQVQYLDLIESAVDPLTLARGREGFRGWHCVAQVRDPRNFGQQIAVKSQVVITDEDAGLLTSARELLLLFKARQEKVIEAVHVVENAASAAIEEKP